MTPEHNTPPDWLTYFIPLILTALSGAFGAVVRQIHTPIRSWTQRILEWVGGAVCAVYGAELIADTIHHCLDKYDLINSSYVVPEKIIGLAGFLCGALGVTIIDWIITMIKKREEIK